MPFGRFQKKLIMKVSMVFGSLISECLFKHVDRGLLDDQMVAEAWSETMVTYDWWSFQHLSAQSNIFHSLQVHAVHYPAILSYRLIETIVYIVTELVVQNLYLKWCVYICLYVCLPLSGRTRISGQVPDSSVCFVSLCFYSEYWYSKKNTHQVSNHHSRE